MAIPDRGYGFGLRDCNQLHAHVGAAGGEKVKMHFRLVARPRLNKTLQQLACNSEDFVLFR